jgi:predicted metal-dependent phosphoesterase TrpH
MKLKLDLHVHSEASRDGGLSAAQLEAAFESGKIDVLAVTDHDVIEGARKLARRFGNRVIVGEEITSRQGEIIGLFLKERVQPGLTAAETCRAIKAQGGLVYIPHPFETRRKGLDKTALEELAGLVDIVETHNGRSLQDRSTEARDWAGLNRIAGAASSDAHGPAGLGRSYSLVEDQPTPGNLAVLLKDAELAAARPPLKAYLEPSLNRLGRLFGRRS